jgi:predicted lipid-binding transport protein (Tim44 family)
MMLALLALVALVAIRWLMRRFAPGGASNRGFAMAGAGAAGAASAALRTSQNIEHLPVATPQLQLRSAPAPSDARPALPADFDAAAFKRIAKMIFIRLQAANDSADLDDLRAFTTPELFAALRLDLQERGAAPQRTDVATLDAELLDFAQDSKRQIVSVRFHGLIREEIDGAATPFDEMWHLVRPLDGSKSWVIAGIQPLETAVVAAA